MSTPKKLPLTSGQLDAVARLFGALADPSRLALLQALQAGPRTVTQLVDLCSMKQANVSKHLAILHEYHLVSRHREGNMVRYQIADPMVFSLCGLVCGKIQRDTRLAFSIFHPEI